MLDQPQGSRHDVASTTCAGGEDDPPLSRPARAAISYYELWCGGAEVILRMTHPWWSMRDVARGRRGRRSSLLQYVNKISYFISVWRFACGTSQAGSAAVVEARRCIDHARGRRGRRSSLLQYVNKIFYFILFQCGGAREAPRTLDQPQWSRHDVASTTRAGGEDNAPLSYSM